jgi:hypothetical protein
MERIRSGPSAPSSSCGHRPPARRSISPSSSGRDRRTGERRNGLGDARCRRRARPLWAGGKSQRPGLPPRGSGEGSRRQEPEVADADLSRAAPEHRAWLTVVPRVARASTISAVVSLCASSIEREPRWLERSQPVAPGPDRGCPVCTVQKSKRPPLGNERFLGEPPLEVRLG